MITDYLEEQIRKNFPHQPTPEQEAAKRRELEQQLYEVFRKYADRRQNEEAGA